MGTPKIQIQGEIVDNLNYLNSSQLSQVLAFSEFLRHNVQYRTIEISTNFDIIDSLFGKYKKNLSDSNQFAKRKHEEILIEEEKWLRK